MKRLMATKVVVALVALVLLATPALGKTGPIVLKLSHLNAQKPFEVATAAMAQVFKTMVEENTNKGIVVELYPAGTLGNERETMEQVQAGIVQSYIASGGGMAVFYPLMSVVDIPFALPNYNVAYQVYDGPFGQMLAADIQAKTGFKVLAFGESGGFFQITNSKRPIRTPDDMKGLKFRTMTIPMHMEIMRAFGASPTPIAWAEVYTALQTGVVDGQHNPIPIIETGKLYEVQKYITLTNHLYTPYVWVMNNRFFTGLTREQQAIIVDAARTANIAGRGLNRILESSEKGLPLLSKYMEVYNPTDAELDKFRAISVDAAMKFIEKTYKQEGVNLAKAFLKAIDDARAALGQ
ncbi:MAG: DctP family TRAP transporter solute-binding subunit [Firmicutes bacterium]|nr:DctP family TRAP transporter solute-binding subunit [Bacillota bacterium]